MKTVKGIGLALLLVGMAVIWLLTWPVAKLHNACELVVD